MFKVAIEKLRTQKTQSKFKDKSLDWINKFWYNSNIKFTPGKSAPGVEKNIVEYIQLLGFQAEKINTTGRFLKGSKKVTDVIGRQRMIGSDKYIKGTGTKGSADISSVIHGLSVKIEVKFGKDRQSKVQKEYEQAVKKAGGFYIIIHDENDFLIKFNELLDHPTIKLLSGF